MQGSIQFSLGILAEAGLSYVGLGVQPPTPSWGRMLADSQTMISFAPNLAFSRYYNYISSFGIKFIRRWNKRFD